MPNTVSCPLNNSFDFHRTMWMTAIDDWHNRILEQVKIARVFLSIKDYALTNASFRAYAFRSAVMEHCVLCVLSALQVDLMKCLICEKCSETVILLAERRQSSREWQRFFFVERPV